MPTKDDAREDPGVETSRRVGRVINDYADSALPIDSPPRDISDNLVIVVIAGVIALALMAGALLLILPGIFEM